MENRSSLLRRFVESQKGNTNPYFDADEIICLIDHFLDKNDIFNLKNAIELGYKLHPDNTGLKISLCKTLVFIEDFNLALKVIEDIKLEKNKDLDLMRLECYCELDKFYNALDFIDDISEENCDYLEEAFVQVICMMNNVEKYQKDVHEFILEALAMFPDNLTLKSELCFNLEQQGRIKDALILCDELINEDPYNAETWYMRGRIYLFCAAFEMAIDSLDFALACIRRDEEPEYEIKLLKAHCLYKNESYQKAISIFEELVSYDEYDNSEVEPFLAACYMCIRNYPKAYDILKHTIRLQELEDKISVFGNFIYCCMITEHHQEALDFLCETPDDLPAIFKYMPILNSYKEQLPQYIEIKNMRITDMLARKYLSSGFNSN